MGFRQGAFARVFSAEDKGRYSICSLAISKKNKETGEYEQEFSDGRVRFVATAHKQIQKLTIPHNGVTVKLGSVDVTNKYDRNRNTTYTNYVVFNLDDGDSKDGSSYHSNSSQTNSKPSGDGFYEVQEDDELPFY